MASTPQSPLKRHAYTWSEPSLDDLFAEPIVQLFMKRDQVDPQDIRGKLNRLMHQYSIAQA